MSESTNDRVALMSGSAALPRQNGELVFEAPWEGRAFGLAVAFCDAQGVAWDVFRDRLIDRIAADDAAGATTSYYERWLAAFESLLLERGVLSTTEIQTKEHELAELDDHQHER